MKFNIKVNISLTAFILLIFKPENTSGACWWVGVNGLNNTQVFGDYYISNEVICNTGYWQVWRQQIPNHLNFLSYAVINASEPLVKRWAITAIFPCGGKVIAYADSGYSLPYYVPKGRWHENYTDAKGFFVNPNIEVVCTSLSAWAITGIVIGSFMGLILLILAIVFIVRLLKKPRRTPRTAVEPTGQYTSQAYVNPNPSEDPMPPLYDPYTAALPAPPVYSENHENPPAYEIAEK